MASSAWNQVFFHKLCFQLRLSFWIQHWRNPLPYSSRNKYKKGMHTPEITKEMFLYNLQWLDLEATIWAVRLIGGSRVSLAVIISWDLSNRRHITTRQVEYIWQARQPRHCSLVQFTASKMDAPLVQTAVEVLDKVFVSGKQALNNIFEDSRIMHISYYIHFCRQILRAKWEQ